MSSASSAVTYTSVYTDSEPYEGESTHLSPDYVPGPEHPSSPDYVPGPEHPPSPIEIPYVPELEYPKYLVPSKDEAPMEDQPLPDDASPAALSPGYVPDSDLEEDPEEDSEEHADYPADGGDGDDEPSGDDSDDDTDDDDEEPFEDEEDDEEEEEHLAPADSSGIPVVDPVPSAGDTEAFKTDESAPTPRPPQIRIPFAQTTLRRHEDCPTPPLPVASPPLPLPSPLTTSPTDVGAPLGFKATEIRMRAAIASPPLLLPSTSYRTDVPEAEMPPRKRACLTTPAPGCEIGESSAAGAARQPKKSKETPSEGVDRRVQSLRLTVRQRTMKGVSNREAVYARIAWTSSEERSAAIEAHVRTLRHRFASMIAQTTSLQTQLTTRLDAFAAAIGRTGCKQKQRMAITAMVQEPGGISKCLHNDNALQQLTVLKCQTYEFSKGTKESLARPNGGKDVNLFSLSAAVLLQVKLSLHLVLFKEVELPRKSCRARCCIHNAMDGLKKDDNR
ncbi:hypothetical protein Tco_0321836 [Tanacetum coccineum]